MSYTVTPLTGHTGAEVGGINLADDIDPAARAFLPEPRLCEIIMCW